MLLQLPASLQSMLEQEPLGLSPVLTVLFSILPTGILTVIMCCSCLMKVGYCRNDKIIVTSLIAWFLVFLPDMGSLPLLRQGEHQSPTLHAFPSDCLIMLRATDSWYVLPRIEPKTSHLRNMSSKFFCGSF